MQLQFARRRERVFEKLDRTVEAAVLQRYRCEAVARAANAVAIALRFLLLERPFEQCFGSSEILEIDVDPRECDDKVADDAPIAGYISIRKGVLQQRAARS